MRPRLLWTVLAAACALAAAAAAVEAAPSGRFVERGTVVRVVDGDTVDVVLAGGARVRVRLLGIDTPERGACFAAQATARTRALALRKRVVLRGDATQDTRDRYGRLLAYAWLPGGKDLGYQLVAGGFAKPYVYRTPFGRLSAYRNAERSARAGARGLWRACGGGPKTIAQPPNGGEGGACQSGYSPCLPVVGDLDCADVRALGKAPVRVTGSDPYRLDGDGDGWGCE